jgi:hypothetical protein
VRRFVVTLGLLLATTGGAVGCSSEPDPGPVFNNEGGQEVACMVHQPEPPGARYTDPAMRETAANLALLRYYTTNGSKPYCDGAAASEADREWAQVYLDLGGSEEKVTTVLG